jgi:hypothetical protein
MSSKIVLYKGKRGAGKTLTMVKDGFQYFKEGWLILRNFKTSFGTYISEEDILKIDKKSKIRDCVIMMDEIQIFFDSRRSMAKQNVSFSNFIQQIRKRNIILLGTTQFSNTVDLRFRQHVDIIAYPNYIERFKVCEVTYIDMTTLEKGLLSDMQEPSYTKIIYNPLPIFKMFNTEEMIK